jgi:hypothetical protein
MTIAIVCGGRDYTDAARVAKVLDAAVPRLGLWCIIEGGYRGADIMARDWALARGDVSVIEAPADWDRDGTQAGPIRNAFMLRMLLGAEGRKAVIAFPGGDGTANMLFLANGREAERAGVKVHQVT